MRIKIYLTRLRIRQLSLHVLSCVLHLFSALLDLSQTVAAVISSLRQSFQLFAQRLCLRMILRQTSQTFLYIADCGVDLPGIAVQMVLLVRKIPYSFCEFFPVLFKSLLAFLQVFEVILHLPARDAHFHDAFFARLAFFFRFLLSRFNFRPAFNVEFFLLSTDCSRSCREDLAVLFNFSRRILCVRMALRKLLFCRCNDLVVFTRFRFCRPAQGDMGGEPRSGIADDASDDRSRNCADAQVP